MAFITSQDYTALIRTEIKNLLVENYGDTKLSAAEQMAISQVKNYISGAYDTTALFAATGTNRNSHIVMIVIDCALYHLYTSVAPDKIPAIRSERYGDAIEWLKGISERKIQADLPKKKVEDSNSIGVAGIPKFTSKYKSKQHRW